MRFFLFLPAFFLLCVVSIDLSYGKGRTQSSNAFGLNLPEGFAISRYAKVRKARSLVVVPELDVVFVSTRGTRIYAISDKGLTGKSQRVGVALKGLYVPNGIAWKQGYLYVAEQHRIIRVPFRRNAENKLIAGKIEVLFTRLPDKRWHGWRDAAFGSDGLLYVAIGAPCNICKLSGLEGTIIRLDPDTVTKTKKVEIFARGVRNSVGLDFHPLTGQLYFTDNGADMMGDDIPPDELNHAPQKGLHFGYPYFGGGISRTHKFSNYTLPIKHTPPVIGFNAHVAALGLHFYRANSGTSAFPSAMQHDAFVAQHGSWNRTTPDGYRIMRIKMDKTGKVLGKEIFVDGWLKGRSKSGRPVDVAQLPDGSLLLSDDKAGLVYRLAYKKNR